MSKSKYNEIVNQLENGVTLRLKTNKYEWEIMFLDDAIKFVGTIYRLSKNKKELFNYYHHSFTFYDKLHRIAIIPNLKVIPNYNHSK